MIRSIDVSCVTRAGEDPQFEDVVTEPPDRVLRVEIISGVLLLRTYLVGELDDFELEHEVEVQASSVLHAIQALMTDEATEVPERLRRHQPQ